MQNSTSVLLGEHFEQFVSNEISSGKYQSADEVIRTALRLLEKEELKKRYLNEALLRGEMSGFEKDFDPIAHLIELNATIS